MDVINWKKYIPKRFVYKNESIDELIVKYPKSMIFSKPMNITLVDNEQNAFTKYIESKRKNAQSSYRSRAKQREKVKQYKNYCIKLQNENNELRKIRDFLQYKKQILLKLL